MTDVIKTLKILIKPFVNVSMNALHTSNKIYLRLLKERVLTVGEKKTIEVSIGGLKELDRITE